MMTTSVTRARIENDLKDAMRAGDDLRKMTLRLVLSAIKFAEIEKRSEIDEAGVISLVQKEIKSHQETIEDARRAIRPEQEKTSAAQIAILESYLPQQLTLDELENLAKQAIAEVGAGSLREMGAVMKVLMPLVAGRASGDQLSQVVRKLLQ
jgi:uncharacterized protein